MVDFEDIIDLGFIESTISVHFTSRAEVDAFGTLVLPGIGEVPALRVNEVNRYDLTEQTLGLPLPSQYFRSYFWLVKGAGKAVHIVSKPDTTTPPTSFNTAASLQRVFESSTVLKPPSLCHSAAHRLSPKFFPRNLPTLIAVLPSVKIVFPCKRRSSRREKALLTSDFGVRSLNGPS